MSGSIERNLSALAETSDAPGSGMVKSLDPRAKILVTLMFVVAVTSFGKYEVSRLMPFALYPAAMAGLSGVSPGRVLKRTLIAAPFILLVGLFNPLFDRAPLLRIGPLVLTGGWMSFFSIIARSFLAVSAAVLLVFTTRFDSLCLGLERLGTPRVFVVQLLFLWRYIVLFMEEARRMVRAHTLRSWGNRPKISPKVFVSMTGTLLLRTLDRAGRVYRAMRARGFEGEIRMLRPLSFSPSRDGLFLLVWGGYFLVCRLVNLPEFLFRAAAGP
ncbi:MAG: cobalt ECF transporter T component CbiQ [Aminobacteriaceae bacterium]|nr:cobalt ECF transporter T component CbiQ [Synergistaceae bacterium]